MEEFFLAARKGAELLQQHVEFVKSVALTVGSAMFVYAGFRWATASGRAQVAECQALERAERDAKFAQTKRNIGDNFVHAQGAIDAGDTKRSWGDKRRTTSTS